VEETERLSVPSICEAKVPVEIQRGMPCPRKLPKVERDTVEVTAQSLRISAASSIYARASVMQGPQHLVDAFGRIAIWLAVALE